MCFRANYWMGIVLASMHEAVYGWGCIGQSPVGGRIGEGADVWEWHLGVRACWLEWNHCYVWRGRVCLEWAGDCGGEERCSGDMEESVYVERGEEETVVWKKKRVYVCQGW